MLSDCIDEALMIPIKTFEKYDRSCFVHGNERNN
jgi:hypothetical protein